MSVDDALQVCFAAVTTTRTTEWNQRIVAVQADVTCVFNGSFTFSSVAATTGTPGSIGLAIIFRPS